MISILSASTKPWKSEWWVDKVKRILKRKRGPDAVRESLVRGFTELGIDYRLNESPLEKTALVLSGVDALREAIEAKRKDLVTLLIAGPNITISPKDHGNLMCHDSIDIVLVPSDWTRDYWANEAPAIAPKIKVWPAGVKIRSASTRDGLPIIYNKLTDTALLEAVKVHTGNCRVFSYGKFKQQDYLDALMDAPYLVYLANSESQGLALQEAWSHNVPTLVNNSTKWKYGDLSWSARQINCPYLTDELGEIFDNPRDIPILIERIASLEPKVYCDEKLSDRASAKKILEIIGNRI